MLTPKQQKVFDIVKDYIEKNGESPTLEEIQDILGFKSKHSVVQFLDYTDSGSSLVFGTRYVDHYFAFKVMPVIIVCRLFLFNN
jgi:hypothetical protein